MYDIQKRDMIHDISEIPGGVGVGRHLGRDNAHEPRGGSPVVEWCRASVAGLDNGLGVEP